MVVLWSWPNAYKTKSQHLASKCAFVGYVETTVCAWSVSNNNNSWDEDDDDDELLVQSEEDFNP
jgi:hypothetical protein